MNDDNTFAGRFAQNENTHLALDTVPPAPLPLAPRQAFLAAHDRLGNIAEAAKGPSLAVVAVDSRARVVDATLIPDRSSLVIGRHTATGLRLPNGPVALRQIALLARHDGQRMSAHLWDLNTEQPFATEDGTIASALVSDGPLYVATGEYALWILATDMISPLPDRAKEAWEALPPRHFTDRRTPQKALPSQQWAPPGAANQIRDDITHVTACAPPLLLQEDHDPEVGWGTLRLASGTQKARHPVSAERLERGVLLGRYERCGLTIGGLGRVSRVHLLIVRIGGEIWAIDAASTNGVSRKGQPISAIVLEPQDELMLADELSITWTQEIHPQA